MPNIASVLKEEIARGARKEVRSETEALKRTSGQYRSDIAALKRRVVALEKLVAGLGKAKPTAPKSAEQSSPMRYSAKGLIAQRQRLGLSGPEMALLLGVSAQRPGLLIWDAWRQRPELEVKLQFEVGGKKFGVPVSEWLLPKIFVNLSVPIGVGHALRCENRGEVAGQ